MLSAGDYSTPVVSISSSAIEEFHSACVPAIEHFFQVFFLTDNIQMAIVIQVPF